MSDPEVPATQKRGRPRKSSKNIVINKPNGMKSTVDWKDFAFNLYCDHWPIGDIAKHPLIKVTESTIRASMVIDKWSDKREMLSKRMVGLGKKDFDSHWRQQNKEVKRAILELVGDGKPVTAAFELYGFTKPEFDQWLQEDDDFHRKVTQGIRLYELKALQNIDVYGSRDWKSQAYRLEKHPNLRDNYAPPEKTQGGVNIVFNFKRGEPLQLPAVEGNIFENELPKLTVDKTHVTDAEILESIPGVDEDILQYKTMKERTYTSEEHPIDIQEKVKRHNQAILARGKKLLKERP